MVLTATLKTRDTSIDVLKMIAIIGVLTIHSSFHGYFYPVDSFNFISSVFWGVISRGSVPIFFMCSGALMLSPNKEYPFKKLFFHNIFRIITALFFWAFFYNLYSAFRLGSFTSETILEAVKHTLLFHHEFHLYYLHIVILVYLFLPITKILTAVATKQQLQYGLVLWFMLGIVYPTALHYWPFTLLRGIPLQYAINLTYAAIGYGVAGFYMKQYSNLQRKWYICLLFFGFFLTFFGTVIMSISHGELYPTFLEGTFPGVTLMAIGIFGACTGFKYKYPMEYVANKISNASFGIYLMHVCFIFWFDHLGFTVKQFPCILSIPFFVLLNFMLCYLIYQLLSRIPIAKKYII